MSGWGSSEYRVASRNSPYRSRVCMQSEKMIERTKGEIDINMNVKKTMVPSR